MNFFCFRKACLVVFFWAFPVEAHLFIINVISEEQSKVLLPPCQFFTIPLGFVRGGYCDVLHRGYVYTQGIVTSSTLDESMGRIYVFQYDNYKILLYLDDDEILRCTISAGSFVSVTELGHFLDDFDYFIDLKVVSDADNMQFPIQLFYRLHGSPDKWIN